MSRSAKSRLPHHYAVYGLTLASNEEIPGLDPEKASLDHNADIHIRFGLIPHTVRRFMAQHATAYFVDSADEAGGPAHVIINTAANGRYYSIAYAEGVEFLLDTHDAVVWCVWNEALTRQVAALYLLGPILGFILRVRGTTCLHASGILVDGQAIAFAGFSGAGKSTLAASFAAAGWPILTDDILPLAAVDGEIYAQPGHGRLRLFPNSFRNLPGLPDELPEIAPDWDKCYLDLAVNKFTQHRSPAALKAIYILDWSSSERIVPFITPVDGAIAVASLAANTYRNELLSETMRKQEFYFLSSITASVEIRRLCPVDDIATLPLLLDMILEDFERVVPRERSLALAMTGSGEEQ